MKADCYLCKYRESIPGDAHSRCRYPGADRDIFGMAARLHIQAERCGLMHGWFYWPFNFDPVWLINCDGFERKEYEPICNVWEE